MTGPAGSATCHGRTIGKEILFFCSTNIKVARQIIAGHWGTRYYASAYINWDKPQAAGSREQGASVVSIGIAIFHVT